LSSTAYFARHSIVFQMSGCSYSGKHNEPTVFPTNTTILTILSFELTVFEMQCIFEIEGSVILVQSYKHLLYSRKGLSDRRPCAVLVVVFWICYAAGGLGLKVVWLWPITSALKGTAAPVTAPSQFAYIWFTGKLAEYGNRFFYILLFKIIFFLYKK